MDPIEYLSKCCGTYVSQGSFKAFCKSDNYEDEFIATKGMLMIPGFYKNSGDHDFIELDDKHFQTSCTTGWNLTALEENSIINCVHYPLREELNVVNTTKLPGKKLKTWSFSMLRIRAEDTLMLSNVYTIKDTQELFFPKDNYLMVVSGKILINSIEKKKKSWTLSSKDQTVTVEDASGKESLVFLLE